jgi:hypothetical protein
MRLISCVLALSLTSTAALAGSTVALSPGAPAGVKKAQMSGDTTLYILAGAAVVAGIAIAASSGSDGTPPTPAPPTTTTATTT